MIIYNLMVMLNVYHLTCESAKISGRRQSIRMLLLHIYLFSLFASVYAVIQTLFLLNFVVLVYCLYFLK